LIFLDLKLDKGAEFIALICQGKMGLGSKFASAQKCEVKELLYFYASFCSELFDLPGNVDTLRAPELERHPGLGGNYLGGRRVLAGIWASALDAPKSGAVKGGTSGVH
jgi:hypothetical protein